MKLRLAKRRISLKMNSRRRANSLYPLLKSMLGKTPIMTIISAMTSARCSIAMPSISAKAGKTPAAAPSSIMWLASICSLKRNNSKFSTKNNMNSTEYINTRKQCFQNYRANAAGLSEYMQLDFNSGFDTGYQVAKEELTAQH